MGNWRLLAGSRMNRFAMRYRPRTLLIALAVGPAVLAGAWWIRQRFVEQPQKWLTTEITAGQCSVIERRVSLATLRG